MSISSHLLPAHAQAPLEMVTVHATVTMALCFELSSSHLITARPLVYSAFHACYS